MPDHELTCAAGDESSIPGGVRARDILLIVVGAGLAFTIGLPNEFIGLDARYALFAKEMLRNGASFFPTSFSSPYPDYPATIVIPTFWLSGINGVVTPLTAIIPTAVVSCGILVFTYLIGSCRSRTWGLGAVCLSMLTLEFLRAGRSVSPDQWTSLATVASFYLAYTAYELGHRKRLCFIPALFVLGFVARGPIGLIIPTSAVLTLCVCTRQIKAAVFWGLVAAALLAVGFWGLLTAAEYQGGKVFAQRVWEMQVSGRVTGRGRSIAYYWLTAFGTYSITYPIALLVTASLWRRMTRLDSANARLFVSVAMCVVVVLAGMSIPGEKKSRYVLSIVPFLALIAAYGVVLPESQTILRRLGKAVTLGSMALPWIVAAACGARVALVAAGTIPGELHVLRAGIGIVLAAALVFRTRSSSAASTTLSALVVGAASLVILQIGAIEPSLWAKERSRAFAELVDERCGLSNEPIVFFRIGPDGDDVVLAANMREPFHARFVLSLESLLRTPPSTCIVAAGETGPELAVAFSSQEGSSETGMLGGKRVLLYRTAAR